MTIQRIIFLTPYKFLFLDKPVCEGERSRVFGVARGEVLAINCTGKQIRGKLRKQTETVFVEDTSPK